MFFYRYTVPGLAIHSYIVADGEKAAVIDPVRDVDHYIQVAKENHLEIKHILETHVHADFVSGAKELKNRLGGTPQIHCSGMGGKEWIPEYADHIVSDKDEVLLGRFTLQAIHTPGHTPEHIMWVLKEEGDVKKLFTGDFLFVGSIGRPDLLGKEEMDKLAHQLYDTTFEKLDPYSDEIEVRPAHGAGSLCGKALGEDPYSTLGKERKTNDSLKEKPEEEWVHDLMDDMPPAPPYFARMKKINVSGAPFLSEMVLKALTPDGLEGKQVIDLRSKEAFAVAHIPGSINIPYSPQVSTWAGWVVSDQIPIVLVADDENELGDAVTQLIRVGFDNIEGYLGLGIRSWEMEGLPLEKFDLIPPQALMDKETTIIDVRTEGEFKEGHVKGAKNIHAGLIEQNLAEIPKDKPISVICGSGFRASIAASILQKHGFKDVSNVIGGMAAWKKMH